MPGTITFKPIEANLNHDTDVISKADPYCKFTVGKQKVKSQVCKSGGKHPVWNDCVTISTSNQSTCLVEIKDKDLFRDDKMGSFEIDLREIESHGRLQKWFPLYHKNKPTGELLMEATYTPDMHSQGMPVMKNGMGTGVAHTTLTGGVPVSNTVHKTQVITKETHLIGGAPLITHIPAHPHPHPHPYVIPTITHTPVIVPPTTYHTPSISTAEQYAREAVLRGVDPLGTHLHQYPQQQMPGANLMHQGQGINVHNYGGHGTHNHNQSYPTQQMTFGHGVHPNKF